MRAILLVAALALMSCVGDDQWSFPLTRAVYETEESFEAYYPEGLGDGSGEEAAVGIVVLLLPLAVDLVLLPITGTRDLIVICMG